MILGDRPDIKELSAELRPETMQTHTAEMSTAPGCEVTVPGKSFAAQGHSTWPPL